MISEALILLYGWTDEEGEEMYDIDTRWDTLNSVSG